MKISSCFCVCVLLASLSSFSQSQTTAPSDQLTIEKIFAPGGITGRGPDTPKWSPDGTRLSFVQRDESGEHGQLYSIDAANGQKSVLVSEGELANLAPPISKVKSERQKEWIQRYHVASYEWAPDSKHLLFDSMGQLWYYSLDNGTAVALTSSSDPTSDPKFSPDGKRIAYIRKHNLVVRPVSEGGEKQLTDSAGSEDMLNGEVDWVYAEELDVRSNYFWEPNGKHLAFLQMNEKQVPTYPLTDLLATHPAVDPEKYPQPGDPNPEVRVGVVGEGGGKVKWISVTGDKDIYIPRFGWVGEGLLYVQVLNRAQTQLDLYFVDASSGKSRRVLSETSPNWVEVNDNFKVLKSGDRFIWSSWRDGYTHLYLYSFDKSNPLGADAKLERQLESGPYEVYSLEAIDQNSGTVYFSSNKDDDRQRQLYSVKLDGSALTRVTKEDGSHRICSPMTPSTMLTSTLRCSRLRAFRFAPPAAPARSFGTRTAWPSTTWSRPSSWTSRRKTGPSFTENCSCRPTLKMRLLEAFP